MIIVCPQCGREAEKATGSVNRSRLKGAPVYCGRTCAGIARQVDKAGRDLVAEKAAYDRTHRNSLGGVLLAKKRDAYYARLARDPDGLRAAQKRLRNQRREQHLEYCRTPEYRAWKRAYDRQHLAAKHYGPFADAALALRDLEEEINDRSTWLQRQVDKGTLNKPQQRKREYGKRSI